MRAIVLAGGGAKGSYQIGVWRALRELGISYDIVCGTSVGALNGLFLTTGEYALAKYIWSTISIDSILKLGKNKSFFEKNTSLLPYIGHYLLEGSFDTTPFQKLVCQLIDLDKVRRSPVRFGIVTTEIPSLYPVKVVLNPLSKAQICSYLLASSALFPAFPMVKIDGESYADGGLFDNLPIDLALSMGADEIIAVGLKKDEPLPKQYEKLSNLYYLTPSKELGNVLDFDHEKMFSNMKLGYQDALSFFKKNHF